MGFIFVFLYFLLSSINGLCNNIPQYDLQLSFNKTYSYIDAENYNTKLYEFERNFVNETNQHSQDQANSKGYLYTNVHNITMSHSYKNLSNNIVQSIHNNILNELLSENNIFNNHNILYLKDDFLFNLEYINKNLNFNNELLKDNKILAIVKYIFNSSDTNDSIINFYNSIFAGYILNDIKFEELSKHYTFNQDYIYFGLMNNISFYNTLLLNSFINIGKTWNITNNKNFDNKFLGLAFSIEYVINFINYLNIKPIIITSYTKVFDNVGNYLNFIPSLEIIYNVNNKLNLLIIISYYNVNIISKNIVNHINTNKNKISFIENSHLEYKFGINRRLFNDLNISFNIVINKELKNNISTNFDILYNF